MNGRILKNAQIHTFDPDIPSAQSLAIGDGKILAVGSDQEILDTFPSISQIEDMDGKCILPGFSDAHIHLLEYGLSLARVHCKSQSKGECLLQVQTRVAELQSNQWVLGHGWDHNIWSEGLGSRTDLDAISANHPVYLTHKSLHCAWANSLALALSGISSQTPDPLGGKIKKGADGEPTGILYESAMCLVEAAIPAPSRTVVIDALWKAQQSLLGFGVTSVHDFDVWSCFDGLKELESSGKLRLRVTKSIPHSELENAIGQGLISGMGTDFVRIGGLKLFADGALGSRTAAMLEPYENSGSLGMLMLNEEQILEIAGGAMNHGISTAIHAIGDRANREVIRAYAKLKESGVFSKCALPPRIEHVQLIHPSDITKAAEIGITASMQPIHALSDRNMAEEYWGSRCAFAYAWRTIHSSGIPLVFGSDAPVESPNPFLGLFAARTRQPVNIENGIGSWHPEQCLTLRESLESYIRIPHLVSGRIQELGDLSQGKNADLIVLPKDILYMNTENIKDLKPIHVMFAGEWVDL